MASTWGKCSFLSNPLGTMLQAPERVVICSLTDLKSGFGCKCLHFNENFRQKSSQDSWKSTRSPFRSGLSLALCSYWLGLSADGPRFILTDPSCHSLSARGKLSPLQVMQFTWYLNDFRFWFEHVWTGFCGWWSCMKTIGGLHRMQETKHLKWRGIHYFGGPGAWDLLILLACNIAITQAHRAHTFLVREFSQRKC